MPFKYAAFSVMMPEYTVEESAKLLQSLGYSGVEWRVYSMPSSVPSQTDFWRGNKATVDLNTIVDKASDIKKLSEDHGLEIVCLGTYLSYKLLDDVKRCMEAAKIMGCGSVRVSAPKYDGCQNYHDIFDKAVDGYGKIEEIARSFKVRANIELHQGSICSSASLAYRFVSNFDTDHIGVILDPGNMVAEGHENWQLGMELLGPYLAYVHIKNTAWVVDGEVDGVKRWKTAISPIKEGIVSWADVLIALDKVGYNGWLSLEDFATGDTKTKLVEDLAYLKSIEAQFDVELS